MGLTVWGGLDGSGSGSGSSYSSVYLAEMRAEMYTCALRATLPPIFPGVAALWFPGTTLNAGRTSQAASNPGYGCLLLRCCLLRYRASSMRIPCPSHPFPSPSTFAPHPLTDPHLPHTLQNVTADKEALELALAKSKAPWKIIVG